MMQNCRQAVGKAITAIYLGRWEAQPGVEMTGIAGSEWYYSDAYLSLDDGSVLRLVCGRTEILTKLPADAHSSELSQWDLDRCIGARIVDIFKSDDPSAVVLLSNGELLENALLPGGSRLSVDRVSPEWEEDSPVEYISLVTGATLTTAEFIKLPREQMDRNAVQGRTQR
jgi:hypothetical protein